MVYFVFCIDGYLECFQFFFSSLEFSNFFVFAIKNTIAVLSFAQVPTCNDSFSRVAEEEDFMGDKANYSLNRLKPQEVEKGKGSNIC